VTRTRVRCRIGAALVGMTATRHTGADDDANQEIQKSSRWTATTSSSNCPKAPRK
jgi:hypothetical protein